MSRASRTQRPRECPCLNIRQHGQPLGSESNNPIPFPAVRAIHSRLSKPIGRRNPFFGVSVPCQTCNQRQSEPYCMKALACCFLILTTLPAMAFVSAPELDSDSVMAGESVHLLLQTGTCDGVVDGDNPTITVSGQQVDVLVEGLRNFDPSWCFFPTVDHSFPLGGFPAGEYVVTVNYQFTPFGLPTETEHLGDLSLSVHGLQPHAVPAMNWPATTVLVLLTLILGAIACTRRAT